MARRGALTCLIVLMTFALAGKLIFRMFGITLPALAESLESDQKSEQAVAYRDAWGNTWNGSGDLPEWLQRAVAAGQSIEHFRCS